MTKKKSSTAKPKAKAKKKTGIDMARALSTINSFHDSFTLDGDDDDGDDWDDEDYDA